jgi:hypothetical protein
MRAGAARTLSEQSGLPIFDQRRIDLMPPKKRGEAKSS